jgi:predicted GIY-YIG superfamily endonuclease
MNAKGKPAVYVLTNKNNTVLYTGVTSTLIKRTIQHKEQSISGFTKRYKGKREEVREKRKEIRQRHGE